jgi:hypothetical protein
LGSYQLRGSLSKQDFESYQSPESDVNDGENNISVDYMVADGSVTFNLRNRIEPGQPLSLLSFRLTSRNTSHPPSYYWSCGHTFIGGREKAQGPNHTNIRKQNLLAICR